MENDAYVTYHGNSEADRDIARRSVLFIDNETAARVLTMEDTIEAVEESYREYGLGRATATRATHSVPRPGGDGWYTWDPMASALPKLGALAIRMKSDILPPGGAQVKKYCVAPGKFCGLILLFSTDDGAPLAIMNDGHIQHMRVGAAGAISVKYMAREDAAVLGLFGTAGMATAHALAITKVRPIRKILVYSPNPEHRAAFADRTSRNLEVPVTAVDDPRRVMEGADIVAACTNSLERRWSRGNGWSPECTYCRCCPTRSMTTSFGGATGTSIPGRPGPTITWPTRTGARRWATSPSIRTGSGGRSGCWAGKSGSSCPTSFSETTREGRGRRRSPASSPRETPFSLRRRPSRSTRARGRGAWATSCR